MLGLALEGGGAKGGFQAGAILALGELGMTFDGVVGTSIGAVNGAMVAQGDFLNAYELWRNIDFNKVLDVEEPYISNIFENSYDRTTIKYFVKKIKQILRERGMDISKMQNIIRQYIDEDKLRSSPVLYGLVTVSITDRKVLKLYKEDIPKGEMCDFIMASGMLPLFKNNTPDGKKYFDGGIYDNLPINLLTDKGFKEIIAIKNGSLLPVKRIRDKSVKITFIEPSEKPNATLNFSNSAVNRAINMGYLDTMRIYKKLLGKMFYVKNINEEVAKAIVHNLHSNFYPELIEALSLNPNINESNNKLSVINKELEGEYKIKNNFAGELGLINGLIVASEIIQKLAGADRLKDYSLDQYTNLLEESVFAVNTKRYVIVPSRTASMKISNIMIKFFKEIKVEF